VLLRTSSLSRFLAVTGHSLALSFVWQKPVKTAFLEMLSEVRTLEDLTSWQAVRAKFSKDRRFQAAVSMSSRHAMIWFNEFAAKQNAQVSG